MTRRVLAVLTALLLLCSAAPAGATPGPRDAPEYWFDDWQLTSLWQGGARGQGITIAEVDTGVNATLPELSGRVLPGRDFGVGGDGRVDREVDTFGHGTAMASIMVGRQGLLGITGIAPDAKVLPLAVPLIGTTDATPNDHLAEAIRWAADHGGQVISMSLGAARDPVRSTVPCPAAEQAAVFYALSKGAVLLAAAGNRGQSTNAVEEPGVCLGVISVGAVDEAGTLASFSSRHPYLTLAAPGVSIASLSRTPGSAFSGDGTSQATAIASAVIALVWSKFPKLTGAQIVTRVLATLARHTTRRDPGYGYGIIDAYRALTRQVPAGAPNPVYAAAAPFLDRDRAFAKAAGAPRPAPAGVERAAYGTFSVGGAPPLFVPRVLAGLGVAAAGLLLLLALVVTAAVRTARRHRRPAPLSVIEQLLAARNALPAAQPGALDWRDITGPPR